MENHKMHVWMTTYRSASVYHVMRIALYACILQRFYTKVGINSIDLNTR
jgi:hypothetical protein